MARRGENIRQRKDKRWEGRYIKGYNGEGKAKYKSVYANSYNECKAKLLSEKVAYKHICHKKEVYAPNTRLSEVIFAWLETIRVGKKHSTHVKYRNAAFNHIINELGGVRLKTISAKMLSGFLLKKQDTGRLDGSGGLSDSTVRTLYAILSSALTFASEDSAYEFPSIKFTTSRKDNSVVNTMTEANQRQLEDTLLENMDFSKFGILLCLYTGLRLGEICALRWEDIDLNKKIIKVRNTVQRVQIFNEETDGKTKLMAGTPKSKCSIRDIPIPSCILNLITTYFSHPLKGYVLTNMSTFLDPRTYQYRFKNYLKSADIDECHFHMLRHTYATNCIDAGIDAKSLSECLGHSNVSITLNKYVHSSNDMKQRQMDKLSGIRGQDWGKDKENIA